MSLKERVYSVLLTSSSEKFNIAVSSVLPRSRFDPVKIVPDVSSAKRMFSERQFDFVIINSPLPDGDGLRFAADIGSQSKSTVPLITVRAEFYDEIYDRAAEHGVYVLSKPTPKPLFSEALDFMVSSRERLRIFEQKTVSVEEKMEEIRLVNRAKWLLINYLKMEEPDAHRYIEKLAMDRCVPKREIAAEIIKTYA